MLQEGVEYEQTLSGIVCCWQVLRSSQSSIGVNLQILLQGQQMTVIHYWSYTPLVYFAKDANLALWDTEKTPMGLTQLLVEHQRHVLYKYTGGT